MFTFVGWVSILSLVLISCTQQVKPVVLTISAGTSLKSSLEEIKEIYTQEKPNVSIIYNFNSSGSHQKAIEQGANVDIYITGGSQFMDNLQSKGFVIKDTRKNLLRNQIILIGPKNSTGISNFNDLTDNQIKRLAISNPNNGSSGKYGEEVLQYFGILEQVKSKFVFAKSGTEIVSFVDKGNADAGIMYATDAIKVNQIKIVAIAPENSHSPITYSAAVLKASKNIPQAKEFVQFLQTDRAGSVFVKYGFAIVTDKPTQ
ncbi:molybdate ABC transporter substrate-binding protein [Argonema galeatum]|uniref:molybdate ABC transporter substrate-binding protein n=1 Tax=Argonema galeatum TaxID=2942762 RepID=UPI0020110C05|nr:molybdate ABC transporter substrate-binding protein [Argonema galeatum]MCL1468078.1 molybdate ABC transporter substrate-binding protein [Argonema galeatum A003/A1]